VHRVHNRIRGRVRDCIRGRIRALHALHTHGLDASPLTTSPLTTPLFCFGVQPSNGTDSRLRIELGASAANPAAGAAHMLDTRDSRR